MESENIDLIEISNGLLNDSQKNCCSSSNCLCSELMRDVTTQKRNQSNCSHCMKTNEFLDKIQGINRFGIVFKIEKTSNDSWMSVGQIPNVLQNEIGQLLIKNEKEIESSNLISYNDQEYVEEIRTKILEVADFLSSGETIQKMTSIEKNYRYVGVIMTAKYSLAHVLEYYKKEFGNDISFVRALKIEQVTMDVMMTCQGCVNSVSGILDSIPDVLAYKVDLSTKQVHLYFSKKSTLFRVMQKLGEKKRKFTLVSPPNAFRRYIMEHSSMKCNGCASKIKSTLEKELGNSLYAVETNVPTKEVFIAAKLNEIIQTNESETIEKQNNVKELQIDKVLLTMGKEFHVVDFSSREEKFFIQGMKCQSCITKIKTMLEELPNVSFTKISLDSESIVYSSLSRQEIIKKIEELGYSIKDDSLETQNQIQVSESEVNKSFLPSESIDNNELNDNLFVVDDKVINSKNQIKRKKKKYNKLKNDEIKITIPEKEITVSFTVSGMSCASCVSKIENQVKGSKGVKSCSVNLLSQRAVVVFNENVTDSTDIQNIISKLGYGVEKVEQISDDQILLYIPELDTNIINKIVNLLNQEYISLEDSSMKNKTIKLQFHPTEIKVRDIIALLSSNGITAELTSGDEKSKELLLRVKEIRLYRNLFFFSFIFTIATIVIGMLLMYLPPFSEWLEINLFRGLTPMFLITLILVTPVQVIGGSQFYILSFKALKGFNPDMNTLISVGAWASYLLSIFSMLYGMIIYDPSSHFHPANYLETSAALITFLLLGRVIENYVKSKTSSALVSLMDLKPKIAQLVLTESKSDDTYDDKLTHSDVEVIDSRLLSIGDIIKILPGEKVAADGVIVFGTSSCNESMITGESIPVEKKIGNEVIGGSINVDGTLFVKVIRTGNNSTLSKIAKLVEDAQSDKPQVQELVDKISRIFVPGILILSVLVFCYWLFIGYFFIPESWIPSGLNVFSLALLFGASVTVVACPCALGLATPLAIMAGTGVGALNGVLIKGGHALELTQKTTAICFDKTGTLTEGKLSVDNHLIISSNPKQVFRILKSAESLSEHPISKALVQFAISELEKFGNDTENDVIISEFKNIPGRGIVCSNNGQNLVIGNKLLMQENNINLDESAKFSQKARTLVYFGLNGKLEAVFGLIDVIRPEAISVIKYLKKIGITVCMVTGDNLQIATYVANKIGIETENIHSNMTPEGKKKVIENLQSKKYIVMHVGDGINDSPALAQADIGLAVGEGTDVAIDCADIVLMKNSISGVATAIHLSKVTFRRIVLNLFFAFAYNIIAVPLAAGFLFPIPGIHLILPPWVAGVAMGLSSISVTISSLLLGITYRRPKFN